jgi:2'-5' RNA ligase
VSRLFLGIPVRLYHYERIQNEFAPLLEGRWRDERQLHVTIAFLGGRYTAEELIERLAPVDWSFEISELTRFDYFSGSRVFVVTTVNPSLQRLYDRLEPLLALQHADLRPHVTLMRVKKINDAAAFTNRLQHPPDTPLGMLEPKIILYKSELHPQGSTYTPVAEWSL